MLTIFLTFSAIAVFSLSATFGIISYQKSIAPKIDMIEANLEAISDDSEQNGTLRGNCGGDVNDGCTYGCKCGLLWYIPNYDGKVTRIFGNCTCGEPGVLNR